MKINKSLSNLNRTQKKAVSVRPGFLIFVVMFLLLLTQSGYSDEKSARELYLKGKSENQQGQLVNASILLSQAIAIDDAQPEFYVQRALSFIGMGQTEKGMQDYKTAVDLKSTNLNVYLALIKYHMDQSQYLLVLIMTDQLIANLPDQAAGAYFDKGRAYEAMDKPDLAVEAYQQSIAHLDDDQTEFKQLLLDKISDIQNSVNTP